MGQTTDSMPFIKLRVPYQIMVTLLNWGHSEIKFEGEAKSFFFL